MAKLGSRVGRILRTFRNSFAAGHVDRQFLSRADTAEYDNACEELVNFELLLSGGATRRAGNEVIADTDVGHRVVAWELDDGNKVLVDFNTDFWRIRPVAGESHPVREIANPLAAYGAAALAELDYIAVLNTFIVVHPKMAPRRIVRNAGGLFSIEELPYATDSAGAPQIPFHRFTISRNIWLSPAAETGATTITTKVLTGGALVDTSQFWNINHVGQWFRYDNVAFQVISLIPDGAPDPELGQLYKTANVVIYGSISDLQLLRLYPASDYRKFAVGDTLTGVTTGATAEVVGLVEDALVAVEVYTDVNDFDDTETVYRSWPGLLIRPLTGMLRAPANFPSGQASAGVTEDVGNGTQTSRTNALESSTGAGAGSLNWRQQVWNVEAGYPGAVTLHAGRLWLAASTELPHYVWGSKAQDFYNFNTGDGFPDDAIAAPITGNLLNRVRYLVDGPGLEIYTDQSELWQGGYDGDPITPESFNPIPSSGFGVLACKPVRLSYSTFVAERSGSAIYQNFYDDRARGMKMELASTTAADLVQTPKELARQRGRKSEGQEVLWGVNTDGTAFQLRWWPANNIVAMSYMTRAPGEVWTSMTYVDDVRYAIVTLDSGARLLEKASTVCWLDQYTLLTDANPQSVWTVPARFQVGDTVSVCTDEEPGGTTTDRAIVYVGDFPVTTGNVIDIGLQDYMRIYVGTTATATLQTTPLEFVPMDGDTRMIPKKVVSYAFPVLDTYYFRAGSKEIWGRSGGLFPAPRDNEDIRLYQLGYRTRVAPRIVSDVPLPVTLLGVTAEVEL